MNEYGVITGPGTIVFRRLLEGPIERVWTYLTDPQRRAEWLAGGPMTLRPGGHVELQFRHRDLSPVPEPPPPHHRDLEAGASFTGRVIRCEPPRLLTFTWAESWGEASEVTFELEAAEAAVLLTLTHRLLRPQGLVSVAAGWHTHLGILEARLAGREPPGFWSVHDEMEQAYGERLQDAPAGRSG